MRYFNAFQGVCVYTAIPFVMCYLGQFDTTKAQQLFALCGVVLFAGACMIAAAICEAIKD